MRFGYLETMTDPAYMRPLAEAAEEVGFDAFVVPDSICYPETADTRYPYNADGSREFLEDKPFIEPFTLIPYLAAATSRIRFVTSVVKLPLRHPVLLAKQLSSIATLAEGRMRLGVGLSPWPEDFAVVGVPWRRRGKRLDEMIDVIRGLMTGETFGYDGEIFQIPRIKICPVPQQAVPILIGGHSEPALRRAARIGDGWIHAGGDAGELTGMLDRLRGLRREEGTDARPFEVHVFSLDGYSANGVKRLEDLGVTDVLVGFRDGYVVGPDTQPLEEKLTLMRQFADGVIAKVR